MSIFKKLFGKKKQPDTQKKPPLVRYNKYGQLPKMEDETNPVQQTKLESFAHKNSCNITHPEYGDNTNYVRISGKARFKETGRMRKIDMCSFNENEARNEIIQLGFDLNNSDIQRIPLERITDGQLQAMRKHNDYIPQNCSKADASALIDYAIRNDRPAPRELVDYADAIIMYSHYTGEKALSEWLIHTGKNDEEKYAHYIAYVRKYVKGYYGFSTHEKDVEAARDILTNKTTLHSFKIMLNDGSYGLGSRKSAFLSAKQYVSHDS